MTRTTRHFWYGIELTDPARGIWQLFGGVIAVERFGLYLVQWSSL